ncbi:hypothetical protein [Reichenbachiella ulvae]|uniref:Uncharacterized protein n=1 Tax=Reichenbachiella ulvae TaxID=2980104 RepID=A0ABT3CUL6_9BACT|nr:hypothetical protein [Reichenbachiella ulvae]MCV9387395.1 hypothetical protein [Reichenbachiella ulvae]
MRSFKNIWTYTLWTLLSLLLGIGYMRLVLGSNDSSEEGLGFLLHVFYDFGLMYVGSIVGSVIALCFVLTDIFYLRKKMNNSSKKTATRLVVLMAITAFVVIVHYLLEKVIDVI